MEDKVDTKEMDEAIAYISEQIAQRERDFNASMSLMRNQLELLRRQKEIYLSTRTARGVS